MVEWIVCGVAALAFALCAVRIDRLERELREAKRDIEDLKNEVRDMASVKDAVAAVNRRVDEIPVDQIRSVYDSEKMFQDGLNAIMSYGVPSFSNSKESVNEH